MIPKLFKIISLLGLILFGPATVMLQTKTTIDVSVCSFSVPPAIKQATSNFRISYSFEISPDGKPEKITKITDRFVRHEEVVTCIQDWRIFGLSSDSKFVANFTWHHGQGWIETLIVGRDFSYKIRINDGLGYR